MGAIHDGVMAAMHWTRDAFTYMLRPRRPAGRRLSVTSAEWLAECAEGDVINGPVREKEEKKIMLMCYENGGFTWSSKSSETGQNRQWRHLQRCSDSRTVVSM
ncbi:hypothetical protein V2W45_410075 [Cenococcum geophilum]